MTHPSYDLYQTLLSSGSASYERDGTVYRIRWIGSSLGKNSVLSVSSGDGGTREYRPGYDLTTLEVAVEDIENDWREPALPVAVSNDGDYNEDEVIYL